jgi:hypothetical protein
MNQEKDETVTMEEEVRIIKFLIIKTKKRYFSSFDFCYYNLIFFI